MIFGGLGQDDIIGGSSALFGLGSCEQRPDGADILFGGAGTRVERNAVITDANRGTIVLADRHARDADTIAADNANIYRLVKAGGTPAYLSFAYDATSGDDLRGTLKIRVRAVQLLDYTPGGPDFLGVPLEAIGDIGGADEVHGESGDDTVYGQLGNDVLFGDSEDDDLIGGWGNDWISGGTGQDGVLGDDGRIYTSRNGTAEPLYGLAATTEGTIDTPGDVLVATIDVTGELKKTVNLMPFNLDPDTSFQDPLFDPQFADDVIYGGWGSDFLHGGPGDDAISGAEALASSAALVFDPYSSPDPNRTGRVLVSSYDRPFNPGNILAFEAYRAEEFASYDEYDPRSRIVVGGYEFLLNFEAEDLLPGGTPAQNNDGDDVLFGDLGNDWLVGGTGRDHLYGGYGCDLLNADDDLGTNGGANDGTDTDSSYEDIAFGGAGRDVLIANTGGDRLLDWAGEYNSYLVPFAPFGHFTISRGPQPHEMVFLYALSAADGADPTRAADTGADPARNGEPEGELGLVKQQDPDWQDQTGAPADPQPGNIPGGKRDVLRGASFNDGSMEAFAPDSGVFQVSAGRLSVAAESLGGDAAAVFHVGDALPIYYEIQASITAVKPTAGWKSNAYVIFDYFSPTDFKFAGIDVALNKLQMGHRTPSGWVVDVQTNAKLKPDQIYNLLVAVNGTVVTLVVDGSKAFSHVFAPRIIDGYSYGLNQGLVGMGSDNSRGTFDNVAVQVLPREITLQEKESFDDGVADRFTGPQEGSWLVQGGRYCAEPAPGADRAVSLIDLGMGRGLEASDILQLEATLRSAARAGIVFDYYGPQDFKYVVIDAASDQVIVGHRSSKGGWALDAVVSRAIEPATDYTLFVSLKGSTVSVSINGSVVLGCVFNAVTVDGGFGLMAVGGPASFDSFSLKTDDPFFEGARSLVAARAPSAAAEQPALSYGQLAPIVEEARSRWIAAGLTEEEARLLKEVSFAVEQLEGLSLGLATGTAITLDADAAGWGWFVDPTPTEDSEFVEAGAPGAAAGMTHGRMDLLTVVMHEMGHVLGYGHSEDGLMAGSLEPGVRLDPGRPAAGTQARTPRRAAQAVLFSPQPCDCRASSTQPWISRHRSGQAAIPRLEARPGSVVERRLLLFPLR